MYGENAALLRTELTLLLRQHRIQQRLGGPGSHTIPETTTPDERQALGEQIARYRHAVLAWCLETTRASTPRTTLEGTSINTRNPAEELRLRLETTVKRSAAGLPTMVELTTPQSFAMVDTWRKAARAAALGEADLGAGLDYAHLSQARSKTILKDAAELTRALVGLDRRYSNIPNWHSLKGQTRLATAAENCAIFAGRATPDYTVDRRGRPTATTTIEQPRLYGIVGVLQAEQDLLSHLATFPDAYSFRLVIDSQRSISQTAAVLVEGSAPDRATSWQVRAATYTRLVRATRDLGGRLGAGTAAGHGAIAVSRIQHLTASDLADTAAQRHLDQLFARIDSQVVRTIERGAEQRLYFVRAALPRIDDTAPSAVKPLEQRYIPITSPMRAELVTIAKAHPRAKPTTPRPPKQAAQSRAVFAAAISHRPEPRSNPGDGPHL